MGLQWQIPHRKAPKLIFPLMVHAPQAGHLSRAGEVGLRPVGGCGEPFSGGLCCLDAWCA